MQIAPNQLLPFETFLVLPANSAQDSPGFASLLADRRKDPASPAPDEQPTPRAERSAPNAEPDAPSSTDPIIGDSPHLADSVVDEHTQRLNEDYSLAEQATQELARAASPSDTSDEGPAGSDAAPRARREARAESPAEPAAPKSNSASTSNSSDASTADSRASTTSPDPHSAQAAAADGAAAPKATAQPSSGNTQAGPRVASVAGPTSPASRTAQSTQATAQSPRTASGASTAASGFREVMNRIGSKSGQPQIMKAEIATAAQAARVIVQGVREGRTEVTMRLRPEGLGPVRIDLAMQNDQIEARIEAATPAARELLNEGLDHLRGALEARGIGVSKLEVVLAAESRHDAQLDDQLPNADRHGDSGGSHDGQDGRRQNRERETDGTTAEPWSAAGAAEPAGMWIERDQSGLAQVRIDATV